MGTGYILKVEAKISKVNVEAIGFADRLEVGVKKKEEEVKAVSRALVLSN